MLDYDLAALYGVPTKSLNLAVKRNVERFPSDFMFQLTRTSRRLEVSNWHLKAARRREKVRFEVSK
jgi:hypothetical protein